MQTHFVLSGDLSFDKVTTTANYVDLFEANLQLLRTHRRKFPRLYKDMILGYNQSLFPEEHRATQPEEQEYIGMSSTTKEFHIRMMAPEEEDQEGAEEAEADAA